MGLRFSDGLSPEESSGNFSLKAWHGANRYVEGLDEILKIAQDKFAIYSVRFQKKSGGSISISAEWYSDGKVTINRAEDADEVLIHDPRSLLVLEGFPLHDVAPVAGRVADGDEDRPVLASGSIQRLAAPGIPVHGIVRMLQEVGTGLPGQTVFRALCGHGRLFLGIALQRPFPGRDDSVFPAPCQLFPGPSRPPCPRRRKPAMRFSGRPALPAIPRPEQREWPFRREAGKG
mgnify:CR=1 FL=1